MQRSPRGLALGLPRRSHQLSVQTNYIQHDNGNTDVRFDLVPGPGTHYFQYRGAWMQVLSPFVLRVLSQGHAIDQRGYSCGR